VYVSGGDKDLETRRYEEMDRSRSTQVTYELKSRREDAEEDGEEDKGLVGLCADHSWY
jgi:hypothetical protein